MVCTIETRSWEEAHHAARSARSKLAATEFTVNDPKLHEWEVLVAMLRILIVNARDLLCEVHELERIGSEGTEEAVQIRNWH